jgi:tetraacyldisaccharide 4'-kinase
MTSDRPTSFLSLGAGLYLISLVYGGLQQLRTFAFQQKLMPARKLACKVICVGNLAVGGTGKTPMTMLVARAARDLGCRPAIVSRGYGGLAEKQGGIVSDGQTIRMGPEQAGDEPYLMAGRLRGIPVIVGRNRYAAGKIAVDDFNADVIVLDDGFQHLKLKRDIDLVLLDCTRPFGNFHTLPRGTLREPASALERATACILTRCRSEKGGHAADSRKQIEGYAPRCPLFLSSHEGYWYTIEGGAPIAANRRRARSAHGDKGEPSDIDVFGFSGIARNADFQATVAELGFRPRGFLEFPDHYRYTASDLETIRSTVETSGAQTLVTTEKDVVRLLPCNPFAQDLIVLGVEISFGDEHQAFLSFLAQQLSR